MKDAEQVRQARKDARQNMERVLQAAHALFAERGGAVTMEEVARRAGVGVGTVYRRFPSKEHLFAAVSHAVCSDTQQCVHRAAEAEAHPLQKLRAIVIMQCQHSAQLAPLLEVHPQQRAAACGPRTEQQTLYSAVHQMLHQTIVDGQRQGVIRQGDPDVLAAFCLQLLNPRAVHHVQRLTGGSTDEVAEQVVQFVLRGLS